MKKIIIDTNGADLGIEMVVKGAVSAALKYDQYRIVLVGKEEIIRPILVENKVEDRIDIINALDEVTNNDSPKEVVKGREDSSLVKGYLALRDDEDAVAMISCGSTGAFLVGSIFRLGMVEGAKRPSLASCLMTVQGKRFALVDCGANIDIDAYTLVSFAKMGTALMRSVYERPENPRVALLNVGKEEKKGNALCHEAYPLLKDSGLNFVGNVEGDGVLLGHADVVVCDGFSGNLILKSICATAVICSNIVEKNSKDESAMKQIDEMFNYNDRGAAIVLGPKKICLKAHGSATEHTIVSVVELAIQLHEGEFIQRMKEELNR